ncbi:MAG: small multi-drug export protein [Clostridiales bacterium]|nr:small multi-drug export protein [Clostridiales bacterium]
MAEAVSTFLIERSIPKELVIFLISMMPFLELRGGLVAAALLDIKFIEAFVICFVGNIIPVPFILLFIRKIFHILKKTKTLSGPITRLEERSMKKGAKVKRWRDWGLLFFVAIPFPGTGGWTGALIAALLDIRIKRSLPIIAVGILIAGIIMSVITYFVPHIFGF